ncbi:plasmid recombination protein [Ottowia sp. VDI28]|uniref:plasmid recombination protein n=1 Tax=Ottowia sp. VDI28 TaxID=3133968 RepID=UPI003C309D0B
MKAPALCFRAKSIGLSRIGGRRPQSLLAAAQHNLREFMPPEHDQSIEADRTHLNEILEGPNQASMLVEKADQLKQACHNAHKFKRRDYCQAIEVLISVPARSQIDFRSYFTTSLEWIRRTMSLPVLLAVVHMDEEHPHMHVLLSPARDALYEGCRPIDKLGLNRLIHAFSKDVAVPYGFRHLEPKMPARTRRESAERVLSSLLQLDLPSRHEWIWPMIDEHVHRDPLPLMELLSETGRLSM